MGLSFIFGFNLLSMGLFQFHDSGHEFDMLTGLIQVDPIYFHLNIKKKISF
jgi:hypothetical protein